MTAHADRLSPRFYFALFLLSLATLLLELSLTRVLSVALWYHFGFLVISTALLGFGASGVTLAIWEGLRERYALDRSLAAISIAFGLTGVVGFWLMNRIPFDPFSLLADRRQWLFMPLSYLTLAAPFYCSGLAFALLLTRGSREVNRLYAFDLAGAGVGCAALALVMPALGGSGSVVAAAALGFAAAAVFGWSRRAVAVAGAALAVASAALALVADRALPISVSPNKGTGGAAKPIYTEWNTFSRIDVYERPADPDDPASRAVRRIVFDRGTAATGMTDLGPDAREHLAEIDESGENETAAALVGKERPTVLVIGSGAGGQVLEALAYGSRSITAVEINPIVDDLVSRRMRDFWGGLFEQPEVRLVTEEGRSFVRRSDETYDAIVSAHTISNAAVASGALNLAENYVLTREAFEDYLDHLAPDGVLYFTRPEAQIPRLFATAREVFERRGLGSPAANLVAYRWTPEQTGFAIGGDRRSFVAGFFLKKTPYTREEVDELVRRLGTRDGAGASGRGTGPELLYTPFAYDPESVYARLVTAPDVRAVYDAEPDELQPATDDRPFFNQHTKWSSIGPATFGDMFRQERMGRLALEDRPVAEVTLLLMLAQSAVFGGALILLPLVRLSRRGLAAPNRWRHLVYFACLGLGFIMIEIALLQRFSLFLGQPVYTYGVVLASLLVFTGAGSYIAGRLAIAPAAMLRWVLPAVVLALAITAAVAPPVFHAALGLALGVRVAISVAMLAPLGLLLGMPFPTGLRIVAADAVPLVPWAWGVNGFFTVTGSVGALILGMALGFTAVLAVAAVCYALALGAVWRAGDPDLTSLDARPAHAP